MANMDLWQLLMALDQEAKLQEQAKAEAAAD